MIKESFYYYTIVTNGRTDCIGQTRRFMAFAAIGRIWLVL